MLKGFYSRALIRAILYGAILGIVIAWLEGRIDRRVDDSVTRALHAELAELGVELDRLRAETTEIRKRRQALQEVLGGSR